MVCGTARGKTIYADDDAPGPFHNGSSWYYAYKYLQDALATAQSGDEIRVAQGVYKPDQGASQAYGDREATFWLITGVTVKGGYSGFGWPNPDARDIQLYETILSGDLASNDRDVNDPRDLHYDPYRAENSYHVVNGSSCYESAVLDGFTITCGNANRYTGECYQGGGMYNKYGGPTVKNCTFRANSASDDDIGRGGGMYNNRSNPRLTNCTFINNSSSGRGGGIYNYYCDPTFTNCTFMGNTAESCGGGINNEWSNPTITNCTFVDNFAYFRSGGVHNDYGSFSPTLTNCNFIRNHSDWDGGAISNYSDCNSTITKCIFSGNSAERRGGGIYNGDCKPTITNCLFTGNRAGQEGGGIFNKGYYREGLTTVTNSTFTGNLALNGNAMACDSLNQEYPSSIDISNCIFYNGDTIWNNDGSIINTSYTDLQGGIAACHDPCGAIVWGLGNIDADPCFALPGYWGNVNDPNIIVEPNDLNAVWVDGDCHLKSEAGRWDSNSQTWVKDAVTSPCIDAGDPNSDWRGELWPHGEQINLGIYGGTTEASLSLSDAGNAADLNLDGEADYRDTRLLIEKWLYEAILLSEDLSRDGIVNFADYAIFAHFWELPARNPSPADGATGVNITDDLSWTAGRGATSHDVYFGTSNPPPFIHNQTATTFDPGTMDYSTTYYWRIDEVGAYGTTTGPVWSFRTIMSPPPL